MSGAGPYASSNDGYPSFIQNDSYDLNSRIMFCSIAFLTFVILFVFIHHVFTKCALRECPPPTDAPRPTITTVLQLPSEEQPKSGLHPSIIASLPMFVISRSSSVAKDNSDYTDDKNVTDTTECPICLKDLEDSEMGRLLPNCGHVFHVICVDMWLVSNSTCPICRNEVEPTSKSSIATTLEVVCT